MATWYADINNAYEAAAGNHTGVSGDPFRAGEIELLVEGNVVNGNSASNGDTVRVRGVYQGTAGIFRNMTLSLTITSWETREPWLYYYNGGGEQAYILAPAGQTIVFEDAIWLVEFYTEPSAGVGNPNVTFRNCLFYDSVQVYIYAAPRFFDPINFFGCTFVYSDVYFPHVELLETGGGAGVCNFRYNFFEENLDVSDWDGTQLTNFERNIFTLAEADAITVGTAPTTGLETNTYGQAVHKNYPGYAEVLAAVLDGTFDTLIKYFDFGLPIQYLTQWATYDINVGWWNQVRYGHGAFYFELTSFLNASPSNGAAPLEVTFSLDGSIEELINPDAGYGWNFGDGVTSTEPNPIHTYTMPGEYTVSVTVTTLWGETETITVTVYVYENDYSAGGRNVTKTDKCFRYAVPQEQINQGIGWSEYNGEFWPLPVGQVGCCLILDENDEEVQLCVDGNTFYTYELGRDDHWTDAGNAEYLGADYEAEILLREHMNPVGTTSRLKHSQARLDFKPWWKNRRNTGDYNSLGFRDAFNADLFVRRDSQPYDAGVTQRIPRQGQLVFDRNFESAFLQPGTRVRGAPWRLTYAEMWYFSRDSGGNPAQKYMTEMQWSQQLSEPLIWIARDSELQTSEALPLNAGSGEQVTGSYTGLMTGPDGYARSAFVMGAADSFVTPVTAEGEEVSLVMWLRSPQARLVLWEATEGGLIVTLVRNPDGTVKVEWIDDNEHFNIPVSASTADWFMLTLVRGDEALVAYENDSLINTYNLVADPTNIGGDITLCQGICGLWGARMVPRVINADCVSYMYNDVRDNHANATENIF